jgi:hypothetical protein
MTRTPEAARRRQFRIWRFQWFGFRPWPHFGVYLTGWFYFSNHSYKGERRYFLRIGERRASFGGQRG